MGCCGSGEEPPVKETVPAPAEASPRGSPRGPGGPKAIAPPAGVLLCKNGCGCKVPEGKFTASGKPFVTCCKACALDHGAGKHDETCAGPAVPVPSSSRPVCPRGARCRSRDAEHLAAEAHPLDEDYSACCEAAGVEAETLSLKVLFDWTDADGNGKLSRAELQATLGIISKLSGWDDNPEDFPPITDAAWAHLDEDGSGLVNFGEFASWAGPRLGLPLGLKRTATDGNIGGAPCSVLGCPCQGFTEQTGLKKLAARFTCTDAGDEKCTVCKHKRHIHKMPAASTGDVEFPSYWENQNGTFNTLVQLSAEDTKPFQALLNGTYLNRYTRDRKRHCPDNPRVPSAFSVSRVSRNENSADWHEFFARRLELETKIGEGTVIEQIPDVKTVAALSKISRDTAGRLLPQCNEWYLFHGTSPEVAKIICETDFKVACAGSNTGTLYGRGLYFAESITKADEYAKADKDGNYAVLLCRVLGGKVLYTDEAEPDPESLVYNCVEGPYDCVLGDREKCKGTFREFVLFDSEDVLPEYVIEYKRHYK